MPDPIQALADFLEVLNTVEKDWDEICDTIELKEKEQQDLLHELELSPFNVFEGYNVAKAIMEVRKARREAKDRKALLNHLKQFLQSNQQLKITLYKVLTSMKQTRENQEVRGYLPRVRTDLKIAKLVNEQ